MPPTLADLERLARQAGGILRLGYEQKHQVSYKGVIDIVTEVDRQSEEFVLREIQERFPGDQIVSEESGFLPGDGFGQWYVDPLDGTINYAHGIPIFSVSIAYARSGVVSLAAVYDPMRDELFSAELNKGAWMNGKTIHVSAAEELVKCLLVTGFPYDAWTTPNNNLDHFSHFSVLTQGVRRLGSAALDLSYVAAGRFDGYWELSLNPWDMAAGCLIAAEAGARITDTHGRPYSLDPPCDLIVASSRLHSKILAEMGSKV
jgi:myo-inositol-1(or 4)-monophosphatase